MLIFDSFIVDLGIWSWSWILDLLVFDCLTLIFNSFIVDVGIWSWSWILDLLLFDLDLWQLCSWSWYLILILGLGSSSWSLMFVLDLFSWFDLHLWFLMPASIVRGSDGDCPRKKVPINSFKRLPNKRQSWSFRQSWQKEAISISISILIFMATKLKKVQTTNKCFVEVYESQ